MQKVSHTIRVDAEDLERWKRAAGEMPLSQWMRVAMNAACYGMMPSVKARERSPQVKGIEEVAAKPGELKKPVAEAKPWLEASEKRHLQEFKELRRREPSSVVEWEAFLKRGW